MFEFFYQLLNYRHLPVLLLLAGLWIQLCFVLSPTWQNQTYYDYGWIVPLLIAFFGYQRWQDAPAAILRSDRAIWPTIFIFLLTLAIVPIRWVEHVDVYWRLPLWIHALLVFSITHLSITLIFGWNTGRSLLPALLFLFLAVPSPALSRRPLSMDLPSLAVVLNSLRVFTLVQIAHKNGRQEMNTAHDTVGFWTMIATFSSIALVAWLLARSQECSLQSNGTFEERDKPILSKSMRTHCRPIFILLILLLGASEGFRLWWFQPPPRFGATDTSLIWDIPEGAIDRRFSETRGGKLLNHDKGIQVLLEDKERPVNTEITYLEYKQGNDRILIDLYLHSPEICFPASGIQLVKEPPFRTFTVEDRDLLVRQWLFKHPISGTPLYAFKVVWSSDDHLLRKVLSTGDYKGARIGAAIDRREFSAAKMILAVTAGVLTEKDAWNVFEDKVISCLSIEDPPPGEYSSASFFPIGK